jgi:hypothetical protein
MRSCKKKRKDNGGETLLEVVMSISLFALIMLMAATMFTIADRTMLRNIEADESVDAAVSMIAKAGVSDTKVEDENGSEYPVESTSVSILVTSEGNPVFSTDSSHRIYRVAVKDLYKYVYAATP